MKQQGLWVQDNKSQNTKFVQRKSLEMSFDWRCCNADTEKREVLEELLPQDYEYRVTAYELLHRSKIVEESKFTAKIFVNISDEASAKTLMKEFQEISNTSYNIKSSTHDWHTMKIQQLASENVGTDTKSCQRMLVEMLVAFVETNPLIACAE